MLSGSCPAVGAPPAACKGCGGGRCVARCDMAQCAQHSLSTAWHTAPAQQSCGDNHCPFNVQRSPSQNWQFPTNTLLSNLYGRDGCRQNGQLFKTSKLHQNSFFHHNLPFYYCYSLLVFLFLVSLPVFFFWSCYFSSSNLCIVLLHSIFSFCFSQCNKI